MAHEHHRLGAIIKSVLDGRNGSHNPLVVGDLCSFQWDIEINSEK